MKRRHFLQFAGSTLAAVGLSQTHFLRQADRYGRALAQDTPRKLALLVGVNDYPEGISSLRGCGTDVRMQYELLVHRFGFNPADVMVLTDLDAGLPPGRIQGLPSRDSILSAFEEHLIKQARAGDVVVFHYSGHGSRVIDPNPIPEFGEYNGTMMPTDARIPATRGTGARDIMGKTLFLLTSALQTDNVTTVLDSCYSGGGTRGSLVYRSEEPPEDPVQARPHEDELAYQEKWIAALDIPSREALLQQRQAGVARGIAIGSAQKQQLAADATFGEGINRFSAGAFTYTLTRYLWQQSVSQPIAGTFVKLSRSARDVANANGIVQEPIYETAPGCGDCGQKPVYFLQPTTPGAEAVITAVNGQVTFWMGGIASRSLEAFVPGAVFEVLTAEGTVIGEVEQTNRSGLTGTGQVMGSPSQPVTPGMFLRERIRGVPANPSLRVGLDPSLEADLAAAEAALSRVNRVEAVPLVDAGELDYLFARMGPDARFQAEAAGIAELPPEGSLGIFSRSLVPVANAWRPATGTGAMTVEQIVADLSPRFKMLLAGKILKSVLNTDTSNVKLEARMEPANGRGSGSNLRSRSAQESNDSDFVTQPLSPDVQRLTAGTEVKLSITNNESRDLYVAAIVVDSEGVLTILHPLTPQAAEEAARLPRGTSLTVPTEGDNYEFVISGPAGFFELLILASTEPLRDAILALERVSNSRGNSRNSRIPFSLEGDEAVDVMGSLLGDIDRSASRAAIRVSQEDAVVDTTRLAAISAVFEVVE